MKIGNIIKGYIRSNACGYDPSEDNYAIFALDDVIEFILSHYTGFPLNDDNTCDLLNDSLHEQLTVNISRALHIGLRQ